MADSIAYNGEGSNNTHTVKSDEEWFAYYDALIAEIGDTGHAYSADGALEYTQSSIPQLEKLRKKYEDRVMLWRGVTGSNQIQ